MGFLDNLFSAGVKLVVTPLTVIKDIADVAEGDYNNNTGKVVGSALESLGDAVKDLGNGKL